jgi:hypothetical protein
MLARSVWWANLVLGVLLVLEGGESERIRGLELVAGTSAPLLAMGRMGLDGNEGSAFRPVAFRTVLTLGMTMAVADAQALLFWGFLKIEWVRTGRLWRSGIADGVVLLAAAAMVLVAIMGLYRLRVWGLLLAGVCAVGIMSIAVTNACHLPRGLPVALFATSFVQLLLTVPVRSAIVRGRAPAPRPPSILARIAAPLVVVLLAATAVGSWWLHE